MLALGGVLRGGGDKCCVYDYIVGRPRGRNAKSEFNIWWKQWWNTKNGFRERVFDSFENCERDVKKIRVLSVGGRVVLTCVWTCIAFQFNVNVVV